MPGARRLSSAHPREDGAGATTPAGPRAHGRWTLVAVLLYTALTLLWSLRVWSAPNRVIYGHGGDEQLTMSFFGLVQHALATGHNPFFTTYLNAPHGVNLGWETTSPLLAVAAWPFDALFGPLVGFNALCAAGFILSATAAYVAFARIVGDPRAAVLGGLVYAAGPFVAIHGGLGQLELSFLVTPPLLALVLHEMLRGDAQRWLRSGLFLAALIVAQFYISVEVLFIEALMVVVVVVLAAALDPSAARRRAAPIARAVAVAAVVSVVCTAFALYVMFTYPYRPAGTIQPASAFPTDAANLVLPTFLQLVGLPPTSPLTSVFDGGDLAEATGYIGVPLLLVAVLAVARLPRARVVLVAAGTAIVALVASLGGHLHVEGHKLPMPLPWAPFAKLPIAQDVLPARFSFVVDVCLALLLTCLVADVLRRGRTWLRVTAGLLTALALVAFIPAPLETSTPPQPVFFTSDAARIPRDSTVLLAPLPSDFSWDAELWQVNAGVRFRILGGYIHGSEADRPATIPTLAVAMQAIEQGGAPVTDAAAAAVMHTELARSGVRTVVLGPAPFGDRLQALIVSICGSPGLRDQGVLVWWTC